MVDNLSWLAAQAVNFRAAAQDQLELAIAGEILSIDPPKRVLEIGTASAGTLWFWAKCMVQLGGRIMSIDVSHHDVHPENVTGLEPALLMHLGDSRDPQSLEVVHEFFEDQPIDFLFIDGDHSYEVSMGDYMLYAPLVRPGGWIGFHDIEGSYVEDGGSWRTWCELRDKNPHDHVEIQLRREGGMGIGLLRATSEVGIS